MKNSCIIKEYFYIQIRFFIFFTQQPMAKELEKNLDKVSQEVSEVVEDVKETMNDVGGRWNKSSVEDKVTTIV
jgi:gas vesicle protein